MILVLLGTQDKQFNRLCKYIEKIEETKICVQLGNTKHKFESNNIDSFDFVDQSILDSYIEKSDIIITHAGIGSIINCLKKEKKVIVVSRLKKYDEHTNDHQLEIAKEFETKGYILSANDEETLIRHIQNINNFKPQKYVSNNEKMIGILNNYIQ